MNKLLILALAAFAFAAPITSTFANDAETAPAVEATTEATEHCLDEHGEEIACPAEEEHTDAADDHHEETETDHTAH